MIISGIVGQDGKFEAANLINSILVSTGKKVSAVDIRNLLEKDIRHVKTYISVLEKNSVDVLIFKICLDDLKEDMLNIMHFDIIIFADKPEALNEGLSTDQAEARIKFLNSLNDRGIAILNIDDSELVDTCEKMKKFVLTYGFNSRACITTSSIVDIAFKDSFICCLQRTIPTCNGTVVQPQEYRMSVEPNGVSADSVLAAASFAIANGIDLNVISETE